MGSLDLATQQLVVIARALSKNLEAADLGRADGCSHGKEVLASVRPNSDAQGSRRRQNIRFSPSVGGLFHFGPHHRHAGRPHPRRSCRQRSLSRRRRHRDVGPRSRRDAEPPARRAARRRAGGPATDRCLTRARSVASRSTASRWRSQRARWSAFSAFWAQDASKRRWRSTARGAASSRRRSPSLARRFPSPAHNRRSRSVSGSWRRIAATV